MSKRSVCLILILALYFGGTKEVRVYSETQEKLLNSEGVVAVSSDSSEKSRRRDEKKKYVEEVKNEESKKRYVGDVEKDEVENRKRRGTEKRYVGKEGEEEFIKEQKAGAFKYDYEKEHDPEERLPDARVKFEENVKVELPAETEIIEQPEPDLSEGEKGRRADIPKVEVYSD